MGDHQRRPSQQLRGGQRHRHPRQQALASHTLDGITITPGAGADGRFVLHVVETVTDGSGRRLGRVASTDITIDVTVHTGVPALFLHGIEDTPIGCPIVSELVAPRWIDYLSSYSLTLDRVPQDAVLTNTITTPLTPANAASASPRAQIAAGALDGLRHHATDADAPSFALHLTAAVAGHANPFIEDSR